MVMSRGGGVNVNCKYCGMILARRKKHVNEKMSDYDSYRVLLPSGR